jgi:hypothetical protein
VRTGHKTRGVVWRRLVARNLKRRTGWGVKVSRYRSLIGSLGRRVGVKAVPMSEHTSTQDRHQVDPEKWCRAPLCKDTNWGGYDRLHLRSDSCPPYSPSPEPNPSAELWEDIRRGARQVSAWKGGSDA